MATAPGTYRHLPVLTAPACRHPATISSTIHRRCLQDERDSAPTESSAVFRVSSLLPRAGVPLLSPARSATVASEMIGGLSSSKRQRRVLCFLARALKMAAATRGDLLPAPAPDSTDLYSGPPKDPEDSPAELHTGALPVIHSTALQGEKLHRVFHCVLDNLVNVMNGYCLPEPYFSNKRKENLDMFGVYELIMTWTIIMAGQFQHLVNLAKKPNKKQDIMTSVSGRIPPNVEKAIKKEMAQYASNITSVLCQFPSQQIANILDSHAATLNRKSEREVFFMNTQSIVQLVQR
ncbi:unnamed protein product [Ranitomeya imitator]|uniref:Acetyl-CoA carboxylase central domain-containing protein n=1 Tax=Ranitomeya imitator TaxID=111125 RepID=A0ABN9LMS6_9NEOB|nr:unnamed protein product [Ranitomeya imitator]